MSVMLSGIVIEVKPAQPRNASSPMLVTPFGIVIEVKLVQSENARLLIFVVFVITTFFSDTGMRSFWPLLESAPNIYPKCVLLVPVSVSPTKGNVILSSDPQPLNAP